MRASPALAANGSSNVRVRRVTLTVVIPAIILVTLAVAVAVPSAMIAFALPPPTGPAPVGTMTLEFSRPQVPAESPPGRFVVQLWYPSLPSADRAPYGFQGGGLKRFVYSLLLRTHSARNPAVAPGASLPILLYVAGWGGRRTDNTVLAEDLASHGFLVAALSDVSFDEPALPRLSAAADFSSKASYEATLALAAEKLRYESRRASAVLDRLVALNAEPAGPFAGRLDARRAGIFGFSLGGAVALETCRRDARFKAAMNLDGLLFDAGAGSDRGSHAPYFLVSDPGTATTSDDLASADPARRYPAILDVADSRIQREMLARGGYALTIDGAQHLSFTDAALYSPMERLRDGAIDPVRVAAIVRKYAVAFFDSALNGQPSRILAMQAPRDPGVAFERWIPAGKSHP